MTANAKICSAVIHAVTVNVINNLPFWAVGNQPVQHLQTNVLALLVQESLYVTRVAVSAKRPASLVEVMHVFLIDKAGTPCNFN